MILARIFKYELGYREERPLAWPLSQEGRIRLNDDATNAVQIVRSGADHELLVGECPPDPQHFAVFSKDRVDQSPS